MLIHFASGPHPFPAPWLNVDYLTGDQRVDLLEPFPENLADIRWAYVGHFLEHLTRAECVTFLRRVRTRMAPAGRIMVVGPDSVKGQEWFDAGRIGADLLYAIKAHGDPLGNDRSHCHLWDCTDTAVVDLLTEAGWSDPAEFPLGELPARYPDIPVIALAEWQFAVTAST
jgi:hypothetical protein